MQLVINSDGAYLHKVGDCIEVKIEGQKQLVSINKVDSILITNRASFSSDLVELAMQHNVDLVFLDGLGNPYARVWQSKLGSTTLIRRRQLEIAETEAGLQLVIDWIGQKLENQLEFLNELARHRENKSDMITDYVEKIGTAREKMTMLAGTLDEKRSNLMGLEGSASRTYFLVLAQLIPEKFKFDGRSRQPAKDEFNAMLNYSYGILYSLVEKACIIAGLDPYLGFLHTDNYNKKSLVFDLIEPYRIIGEKTVFYLFSKRQVNKEFFDPVKNGIQLNQAGKQALIAAFNDRMEQRIQYHGRLLQQKDVMQFDCHRIANQLIGAGRKEQSAASKEQSA